MLMKRIRYPDELTTGETIAARVGIFVLLIGIFFLFLSLPEKISSILWPDTGIHLYTYGDYIAPELLQEFEQQTGIPVHVKYFDSNEELLAKFRIDGGKGYDLITPVDFMVELLIREHLLQKLDHRLISNISKLDARLMHHYFDPHNTYSLPRSWCAYGLGYDKKYFGQTLPENSWSMIFTPPFIRDHSIAPYRFSMVDDGREAVFLAGIYLLGRTEGFSQQEMTRIKNILIRQKDWVEIYTHGGQSFYLQGRITPLVVTSSNLMMRMNNEDKEFGFVLPKEGSIIAIDNLAIPATSTKAKEAHKLIDFLLSKRAMAVNFDYYGDSPSNLDALELIDKKFTSDQAYFPPDEVFERLHLLNNAYSIQLLGDLWIQVKCS